jgi:hypothetical protein
MGAEMMSITERNIADLQSKETAGSVRYGGLVVAAALSGAVATYYPVNAELPRISIKFASGSYPATIIRNKTLESRSLAATARSELSSTLRRLRAKAIANGMPLLTADELSLELRDRRGEQS